MKASDDVLQQNEDINQVRQKHRIQVTGDSAQENSERKAQKDREGKKTM